MFVFSFLVSERFFRGRGLAAVAAGEDARTPDKVLSRRAQAASLVTFLALDT